MGIREDARLIRAVQCGLPGSVAKALRMGARPDADDGEGWSALAICAADGRMECAEILLEAGADIECRSGKLGALAAAAGARRPEMVEMMLARGARVDAPTAEGSTALIWASGWAHGEPASAPGRHPRADRCVELLLGAGADLARGGADGFGVGGSSPWIEAARWGRVGAIEALCSAAKALGLWTKLPLAEAVGMAAGTSMPALKALLAHGAPAAGAAALVQAVEAPCPGAIDPAGIRCEAIRLLVQAGAGLEEQRFKSSGTALLRAVELRGPAGSEALLLVELGADFESEGPRGLSALDVALSRHAPWIEADWRGRALAGRERRELAAMEAGGLNRKGSMRV